MSAALEAVKLRGDNRNLAASLRKLADELEAGDAQVTAWSVTIVESNGSGNTLWDGHERVTLIGALEWAKHSIIND